MSPVLTSLTRALRHPLRSFSIEGGASQFFQTRGDRGVPNNLTQYSRVHVLDAGERTGLGQEGTGGKGGPNEKRREATGARG
eukprot:4740517-Prymnesium_polylepis.1